MWGGGGGGRNSEGAGAPDLPFNVLAWSGIRDERIFVFPRIQADLKGMQRNYENPFCIGPMAFAVRCQLQFADAAVEGRVRISSG